MTSALACSYADIGLPRSITTAEQAAEALRMVWELAAGGKIGPDEAGGLATVLAALHTAVRP